jgi:ABC-2 type transport system permease protein
MNARSTFLWCVRRELWEHRAIFIAPVAVASLVLVAFLFNLRSITKMAGSLAALPADKQALAAAMPFSIATSAIVGATFLVGIFYCLDALYGERRDRSILFWKSMPVSDLTTVASKAFIPMVVMPLVALVIALVTHVILLGVSGAALKANGLDASTLWSQLPFLQMPVAMAYSFAAHSLWLAPVFAWLLLVSAWAKKAPSLWAVLPVIGALIAEKIAIGTSHVANLIQYRFAGVMQEAFTGNAGDDPVTRLSQLDPLRFLGSLGLWTGLIAAAAMLAGAIWLRRRREPI